jgi:hypothetical protein
LLALNRLRVSEATGAGIEHLGLDRGHRTPTITRESGKVVTIPLAPRTARAIDLAIGERADGPVFLAADGWRLDQHDAGPIVRKVARRTGISKAVTPHTLTAARCRRAADHHHPAAGGPATGRTGVSRPARLRPLDLQHAQHCLLRAAERDEERVPCVSHLMPAVGSHRRPDQPPVLGQHPRIPRRSMTTLRFDGGSGQAGLALERARSRALSGLSAMPWA